MDDRNDVSLVEQRLFKTRDLESMAASLLRMNRVWGSGTPHTWVTMGSNFPGTGPVYGTYPSKWWLAPPFVLRRILVWIVNYVDTPQERILLKDPLHLKYDGTHMDFCQPTATRSQMNSEAKYCSSASREWLLTGCFSECLTGQRARGFKELPEQAGRQFWCLLGDKCSRLPTVQSETCFHYDPPPGTERAGDQTFASHSSPTTRGYRLPETQ